MHFETRLWGFTYGVRWRIAFAVLIGLVAMALGVARLALLGWLIGRIFAGDTIQDLAWPIAAIAAVMILRGGFEHWRNTVAHRNAAIVQKRLRRTLFDKVAELGPAYVGRERSGSVTLTLVDGVEQLETYFGQYMPQGLVALLTPILIFAFTAFLDLPVALVLFGFALLALFAPAAWHSFDESHSRKRQVAYAAFAAEFLDSIQGLPTLKAFGQSTRRADSLATKARDLFQRTMLGAGDQRAVQRHHRQRHRLRRGPGPRGRRLAGGERGDVADRPAGHPDDGRRAVPAAPGAAQRAAPGHGWPCCGEGRLPPARR